MGNNVGAWRMELMDENIKGFGAGSKPQGAGAAGGRAAPLRRAKSSSAST